MSVASSELSKREGSHPAGSTLSKADQDINHLCRKGTVLAHVQFGIQKDTQVLFCNTAFQIGDLQHILVCGIVPYKVQDLALFIVELHRVPVSPFVQLVEVPLDGSATLWFVNHSSKFFVTSRLAEGTHSVPSSRPLLKTLNKVSYCIPVILYSSHCIDLWGTSLVIGLQLDLYH